jgi:hypothetical protein
MRRQKQNWFSPTMISLGLLLAFGHAARAHAADADAVKVDKVEEFGGDSTGFDKEFQSSEMTPESVPQVKPEVAPAQTATTTDEPDLQLEAHLHDIFVNYYSAKTADGDWQKMVGNHASEKYKIHKGDNLWNISQTLFGDGNYWPKIWSLNSGVTNPHLISPNNQIRFLLGDESAPPAFTVTENATGSTPAEAKVAVASNAEPEAESEPEIPPPLKPSRPVVKQIPPSLPEWQDTNTQENYDNLGIDYGHRKIVEVKDQLPLVGYIAEKPPVSLGSVREVEVGNNMASAFQYIYVLMNKGEGQIGDTLLAVSNLGEVQSVHPSISGFLGYSIEVQGEVQLVEKVDSKPEAKGDMYRALVTKIINPVSTSAILISGKIENVQVSEEGPRSQVVAQIIGGSYFNRRQVYGNQSVAFLNRGELDGLKEGEILPIRANRAVRQASTDVLGNVRPIGWMRVVKTTPHFATALVVRVWSDVLTGDLTGSGSLVANTIEKSEEPKPSQAKKLIDELDEDEDLGAPPAEPNEPPSE